MRFAALTDKIRCFEQYYSNTWNLCSEWDRNAEFSFMVQQKLDAYKADDHTMGQVSFHLVRTNVHDFAGGL